MKKIVSDLRNLAKNQIETRLKLLQDGSYVPNDILAITLKSHGKRNKSCFYVNLLTYFLYNFARK
jgi:hypothetical protein